MAKRSRTAAYHFTRAPRTQAGKSKPTGTGQPPKPKTRGMNKTEERFALRLEEWLAAGQISAWWFEPISWKLADATRYVPDFMVQHESGALALYEVKGTKGREYMTTPDAWVKLKIAAEQMPFPLTVAWQTKDGHWHTEPLN